MHASPALLTVSDVAERLSVSTDTVRRYLRSGELPAVRLTRDWRVEPAALEAFVAARTTGRQPAVEAAP